MMSRVTRFLSVAMLAAATLGMAPVGAKATSSIPRTADIYPPDHQVVDLLLMDAWTYPGYTDAQRDNLEGFIMAEYEATFPDGPLHEPIMWPVPWRIVLRNLCTAQYRAAIDQCGIKYPTYGPGAAECWAKAYEDYLQCEKLFRPVRRPAWTGDGL